MNTGETPDSNLRGYPNKTKINKSLTIKSKKMLLFEATINILIRIYIIRLIKNFPP